MAGFFGMEVKGDFWRKIIRPAFSRSALAAPGNGVRFPGAEKVLVRTEEGLGFLAAQQAVFHRIPGFHPCSAASGFSRRQEDGSNPRRPGKRLNQAPFALLKPFRAWGPGALKLK